MLTILGETHHYHSAAEVPMPDLPKSQDLASLTLRLMSNIVLGLYYYANGIKTVRGKQRMSKDFAKLGQAVALERDILAASLSALELTRPQQDLMRDDIRYIKVGMSAVQLLLSIDDSGKVNPSRSSFEFD